MVGTNEWLEIEHQYFDNGISMKSLSNMSCLPYRRVQKHLQRHPRYKQSNIDSSLGIIENLVKEQSLKIKILDDIQREREEHYANYKPRVVGVIGDLHAPFTHKGYIKFLKKTFDEWGVTDVIFIGDIVDNHAISRHQTETSAKGAEREYQMAYDVIQEYVKVFPNAKITLGNHDDIPNRQAATLGIPTKFMQKFQETWGLPDTYEVANHFIIDNVLYHHGLGASGQNGAINKALNERMSVVQGHQHSSFQVEYRANQKDIIFGVSCGCGVDNNAYAFNYGKYSIKKPILGTAIIKSSSEAYIIPMPESYFGGA